MGGNHSHQQGDGGIPSQGGLLTYREAISNMNPWYLGVLPPAGGDEGHGIGGG